MQDVDLTRLMQEVRNLPQQQREEILSLVSELDRAQQLQEARHGFLPFVKTMWPGFIEGRHHEIIAKLFDDVVEGRKRRVIINMPPRHTKSEFASIYLPAYFMGRYPDKKIIQTSHTAELAVGFGRKVKGLIARESYQDVFPNVALSADSKAAGRWATNKGGEYYAIGVGGAIAGKGADLFIIDDPHSEQEQVIAENTPEVYDRVMEWYEGGPRQRLQPGGAIILVMTRWSLRDLTAQLLKKQMNESGADQWEVVEFPAILPSGTPVWPQYWTEEELLRTKASIPISKWNAQYQQNPTAEEGALIKREYWRDWDEDAPKSYRDRRKGKEISPPECHAIIQSWDTAFSRDTRADYSACTTWGVFWNEEEEQNHIILLDAERGKWEFPQLKEKALQKYNDFEPDICLIEARAAGQPLIYEMRRMGIPIQDVKVGRGTAANPNDKFSRVNSVTDIFASHYVWAPKSRMWAQEVIEEAASFPAGEHDDYVDTVVMAMQRFRVGGWVGTRLDEEYEETRPSKKEYY